MALIDGLTGLLMGSREPVQPRELPPLDPDTPLENFLICIPTPPATITGAREFRNRRSSDIRHELQGRIVQKGTPIALCGDTPIISPIDGKIHIYNPPRNSSGGWLATQWPRVSSWPSLDRPSREDNIPHEYVLVKIQPVRGSDLDDYIKKSYVHIFNNASSFDKEAKSWYRKTYNKTPEQIADHEERYKQALGMLRIAALRKEPVHPGPYARNG